MALLPHGVAVGPTRALVDGRVSPGAGSRVVVQYGSSSDYRSCSSVEKPGAEGVSVQISGLRPNSTYHFRLVARTPNGPAFGLDRTFRTLASGHVPEGVKAGSVAIGGLSRTAALAALRRPVAAPLRLSFAGAFWHVSRSKAGARIDARRALATALVAAPRQQVPAPSVSVDMGRLRSFVTSLSRRWTRKGQQAGVRLQGTHAVVKAAEPMRLVDAKKMTALIDRQLRTGGAGVLPLVVESVRAPVLPTQKAVVVRLGSQTLTAYLNGKAVLQTPITTGRAALPTPIGSYFIHFRASPYTFISPWPPGSPYYYPPAPVTWAMYFFDNDFLHDDPAEPSSAFGSGSNDGPYASHGCVHVPHDAMAFLYGWLPVGAPVIVSQT